MSYYPFGYRLVSDIAGGWVRVLSLYTSHSYGLSRCRKTNHLYRCFTNRYRKSDGRTFLVSARHTRNHSQRTHHLQNLRYYLSHQSPT